MRATVVIGAGFGDEGKGATVDALAASAVAQPVVVRFNGGAQAGHTVVTPDGTRHVFSHFSAGTFAGAITYLSRYFVCNPRVFLNEWAELVGLGVPRVVYIDPAAEITTPYDVMINRALEHSRGDARHGSVGIGFGETLERVERGVHFPASLIRHPRQEFEAALVEVRKYSVLRLAELGLDIDVEIDEWKFWQECRNMSFEVKIEPMQNIRGKQIIFEGAQGLLLDQKRGYKFPHVTRSNTGIRNAGKLACDLGIDELNIFYVTRCYTTRHGAGPMIGETEKIVGVMVADETNTDKPWQGKLRLAPLMANEVRQAIMLDLGDVPMRLRASPGVVMTCLDQATYLVRIKALSEMSKVLPIVGEGWGPDRKHHTFGPMNNLPLASCFPPRIVPETRNQVHT